MSGDGISLGELLQGAMVQAKREGRPRKPAPSIEGQKAVLTELAKIYDDAIHQGPAFEVGDFVTPREGMGAKYAGIPHIVVETVGGVSPTFTAADISEVSSNGYGRRLDMRVMLWADDGYTCFWVESYAYVPFEE